MRKEYLEKNDVLMTLQVARSLANAHDNTAEADVITGLINTISCLDVTTIDTTQYYLYTGDREWTIDGK